MLKVVLIVVAILAGTTLICCTGMWFAGERFVAGVREAVNRGVAGSGVAAEEERVVGEFDAIRVEGLIDVDVTIGGPAAVRLRGDDNVLPLLTTEVVDGTLVFSAREHYDAKLDLQATVVVPALRALTLDGLGNVTVTGIDETSFAVTVLGIGSATVEGRCDTLEVAVEGMGDARLPGLVSRTARVRVAGIGDAEVHATESLDATVTGMGDVRYHGTPRVRSTVDGMGHVLPAE